MGECGRIIPNPRDAASSVIWEIEDFFSAWEAQSWIFSPNFTLQGADWYLGIDLDTSTNSVMHAKPHLRLSTDCTPPDCILSYKFGFLGKGGIELGTSSATDLEEDDFGGFWVSFNTMLSLQLQAKDVWAPNGRLTVFCTFQLKDYARQTPICTEATSGLQRLGQDMRNLLLSQWDADVTLMVKDQEFHVHRVILGARSPVFQAMFEHDMLEKRNGVVKIQDCEPEAFGVFLNHLYSGTVEGLSGSNVALLYKAADYYSVEHLKAEYLKFMRSSLSVDMICDVVNLALQHGEFELLQEAMEFFARNVRKIVASVAWQTFLNDNPVAANELYLKALQHHGVVG